VSASLRVLHLENLTSTQLRAGKFEDEGGPTPPGVACARLVDVARESDNFIVPVIALDNSSDNRNGTHCQASAARRHRDSESEFRCRRRNGIAF
jgi:hypothetical protein